MQYSDRPKAAFGFAEVVACTCLYTLADERDGPVREGLCVDLKYRTTRGRVWTFTEVLAIFSNEGEFIPRFRLATFERQEATVSATSKTIYPKA